MLIQLECFCGGEDLVVVSLRARDLLPNLHSKGVTTVLPLDPILDLQTLKPVSWTVE